MKNRILLAVFLPIVMLTGCISKEEFRISRAPVIFAENPSEENMAGLLREGLGDHVEVLVSETDINPFVTDRERYCLIAEQ